MKGVISYLHSHVWVDKLPLLTLGLEGGDVLSNHLLLTGVFTSLPLMEARANVRPLARRREGAQQRDKRAPLPAGARNLSTKH